MIGCWCKPRLFFPQPPWCEWMFWRMLSRASTTLRREANARSSSGHVLSHRSVLNRDDEAWAHWWILDHWWSQSWEDCCEPHRKVEQVWNYKPQIWYSTQRPREMAEQPAPLTAVWLHCADNLGWHHGPWRGKTKTYRRENPGILFLAI